MQKPAVKHQVKSMSLDTSKAQLAKANYKKAGTKPPIKPNPELNNKDEEYEDMEEGMEVYEPIKIMTNSNKFTTNNWL